MDIHSDISLLLTSILPWGADDVGALYDQPTGSDFLADRHGHARVHRFDVGGKYGGDATVAADQVFVEIPARNFERTFRCGPFVEGMRIASADFDLGGKRKSHAIF